MKKKDKKSSKSAKKELSVTELEVIVEELNDISRFLDKKMEKKELEDVEGKIKNL